MNFNYEENLQENPFWKKIMEDHNALMNEVGLNNWIILIPQKSQISDAALKSPEFLLSHVLAPSDDLPKTHFTNLIGDDVVIVDDSVKIKDERKQAIDTKVLFEEMYYTHDMQKIKIICIDIPLCRKFIKHHNSSTKIVQNLTESLELLTLHCSAKGNKRKIENAISNFVARSQKASDYDKLKTNIKLLYDYCVNLISNRSKNIDDPFLTMNLKIAIEYILMDAIYEKVFGSLCLKYSEENQKFNKIIGKLRDICVDDLNMESLETESLKLMKIEVTKIANCRCSIDKLECMKGVIDTISTKSGKKLMTVDELLPILVYLVIKSNYYQWIPTLIFVQEFNLSQILASENQSSLISFVLTTFEAVIFFIQTNENMSLKSQQFVSSIKVDEIKSSNDLLQYLFNCVKENNEVQLMQYLNVSYDMITNQITSTNNKTSSCHPLCTCSLCKIVEHSNINSKTNDKHHTMLHIASIYNVPKMITTLMNLNANLNARDINLWTSLHHAAYRGHQKVLFLLLHGKSEINSTTNDKKTALILAAMNGHDCCVKALLYFSDHSNLGIDLNAQDVDGNTAIHYASQRGYEAIVDGLLEYKAKVSVKNNLCKIPLDFTFNSIIREKLEIAAKYQVEELPINESDYVFISNEDLADNHDDVT
jgi:ankyrin repeat domain-containing protein 27